MAEKLAGPVAQWDFVTCEGDTIYDTSGHGLEAKMIDGRWVKQAEGFALEMNGSTTFVDCGSSADMGITGPVTIEGWVKPTRKAFGESSVFGTEMRGYMLTYYNTEICMSIIF